MLSVMKVEKAPLESYANIGDLDEAVELLRGLILHIFGFKIHCTDILSILQYLIVLKRNLSWTQNSMT